MDSIFNTFLSLILGFITTYCLYSFYRKKKNKELTKIQEHILLEKITTICKLIAMEGDFAEIYRYENTKERLLSLVSSKKRL
jgi:heme/copper-type cytochrome/quinol oxidase subunit 2